MTSYQRSKRKQRHKKESKAVEIDVVKSSYVTENKTFKGSSRSENKSVKIVTQRKIKALKVVHVAKTKAMNSDQRSKKIPVIKMAKRIEKSKQRKVS